MLYIGDCETNGLEDEVTKFHCICFSPSDEEKFYIFCNYKELEKEKMEYFKRQGCEFFPTDYYLKLLNSPKTKGICIHNLLGYDLPVFKKLSGIEYNWESINDRKLKLIDSLVLSRYLYPDRPRPKGTKSQHSLEAWGIRTKIAKPKVEDWSDQPLSIYVNRVLEDVKINKATYFMLLEEAKDVAITNGERKGDWSLPLRMAHKSFYLMKQQEKTGVKFNIEGAKELIKRIDKEMKEIEEFVEPELGERCLPKNQQPNFPSIIFKKAFDYEKPFTKKGKLKKGVTTYLNIINIPEERQEDYIKSFYTVEEVDGVEISVNNIERDILKHSSLLTTHAINYCAKFGIIGNQNCMNELYRVLYGGLPERKLREKLKLSHKKDVKEFLVTQGWEPTLWKSRNIVIDKDTKKKKPKKEIVEGLERYLKEFSGSVYWKFICEDLGVGVDVDIESEDFRKLCIKKGRGLLSSPQYTDQRNDMCKNLEKLNGEVAKKICKWLSLQNRRNNILSENGTGWLAHPRLEEDGRLPAKSTGITNTNRQKHSVIVNVPKPKKHVVLGKEMRGLFISRDGYYQVGCDACGLEARVTGHYTYPFDNGAYANELLEGDTHTKNAEAYSQAAGTEINRDDGKNATYAIIYGVAAKKLAKMLSVSEKVAGMIIDAFWDTNIGLTRCREAVIKYWELTGKKYIMGIDGRKIFVRSKHSAMNALFQSTGAIIMDFAGCWSYDRITHEGLDWYRTLYVHDEYGGEHNKDEVELEFFSMNEEPEQERGGKLWSKPKEIDGAWVQYYSRAGELIARGIEAAGRYYKMNLPFPGEYMVGGNWAETH